MFSRKPKKKMIVKFDYFTPPDKSSPFLRHKGNCDTQKMARKVAGLSKNSPQGTVLEEPINANPRLKITREFIFLLPNSVQR